MPRIDRLLLATVTRVPEWHPEHETFRAFPVHAWVIHHPDGVILFDTGIGTGNDAIDGWYAPEVTELSDALGSVQVTVEDIAGLVLSHLHFDHCGQQRLLDAPVFVQSDEHLEAQQPGYTVEEWAAIPPERLRLMAGDAEVAEGVKVLATPGHTPGHQSVVVDSDEGRVVLAGQCAFRAVEVRTGEPQETNLHDPSWREAARDSLARIRELRPSIVQLSHDDEVVHL